MRIAIILLMITVTVPAFAQNAVPVISDLSASISVASRTIRVKYTLKDAENDKVTILFKASNDGGETYLVNTSGAKGHVGKGQVSGSGKEITWKYPDTLNYVEKYKIKLVADDLQPIKIEELVDAVDSARLRSAMVNVFGIRSHENTASLKHLEIVRVLLESQFKQNGMSTERQKATIAGYTFQNVLGRKGGHDDEAITYLVGAHMDTEKRSPGADDNGSGIVGLLEAAKVLSRYQFRHSLRFVGFDGEEIGNIGSKMYTNLGIKRYEQLDGVINFDMIGFYSKKPNSQAIPDGFDFIFPEVIQSLVANGSRGDFILSVSNAQSRDIANAFASGAREFVPSLKVVSLEAPDNGASTPELTASDHYQFWSARIPALHIGDGGGTRNKNIDTNKDLLKDLNYTFMSNVVKATVATFARLAVPMHCSVSYCNLKVLP